MDLFLFKLLVTPLMIGGTTLATRKWGPTVGGWLVGLPLTSGPVSVFLLLEQGPEFASQAAVSSLNGLLALVGFCLIYVTVSRRCGWVTSLFLSLCGYFATVLLFAVLRPGLFLSLAGALAFISLVLYLVPPVTEQVASLKAPPWDLPFRILTATALVVGVTTASQSLGPQLSGLFSTFPIFICVMSIFSHRLEGGAAVRKFERGVVVGSYSFVSFFLVVSLSVGHWSPVAVYAAATLAAMLTNLLTYKLTA